ncbi:hypothetical protein KSP40_PGU014332 [Platanthera guangdongensis]|uniref:Uncharacterized protein n=1 Tax=Platanthera guangdongensis TaxID=2320717 RepID=A0ABR2LYE3_9ASPA
MPLLRQFGILRHHRKIPRPRNIPGGQVENNGPPTRPRFSEPRRRCRTSLHRRPLSRRVPLSSQRLKKQRKRCGHRHHPLRLMTIPFYSPPLSLMGILMAAKSLTAVEFLQAEVAGEHLWRRRWLALRTRILFTFS